MTPEKRLDAALERLDKARKARGLAITDDDRDATWQEFVKALGNYNRCLRESQREPAGPGA